MGSLAWRYDSNGIMSVETNTHRLIVQRLDGAPGETRFLAYNLPNKDNAATLILSRPEQSVAAAMDAAERFIVNGTQTTQIAAVQSCIAAPS